MNISDFEAFLTSQREGFKTFLKGCKDLDRDQIRTALRTHEFKMMFALTTENPIPGRRSVTSPFKSPTPVRAARQTSPSPFRSPAPTTSFQSGSPPGSSKTFKTPGSLPEFKPLPNLFKRNASSASATPANTPTSKKTPEPDSAKSSRVSSVRSKGMTLGGAARLFKPATPKGKGYMASESDSSAGSPAEKDPPYAKRSTSASAKKNKKSTAPTSPFEIAARLREVSSASKARKHAYVESESSTDDFDIPIKSTVRKVSSAKGKEKATPKKAAVDRMGVDGGYGESENDDIWEDGEETPSKKQKVHIELD